MKHLQADLSMLFQPSFPKREPIADLPCGAPYIPRMPLSLMPTCEYFTIRHLKVEKYFHPLTPTTLFLYDRPVTSQRQRTTSEWFMFAEPYSNSHKRFRTEDEAYIELFHTTHRGATTYPEKFAYIQTKYPEYFI
jgi:hypothetical protein